jgi:hypothetical protein
MREQIAMIVVFSTYAIPVSVIPWWSGTAVLIQAFIALVIFIRIMPFHTVAGNAIYCGFLTARVFVSCTIYS